MKHHFEEWYEKLYYKREISDSVKELFEESAKCHKAGTYKSAIVMGVTGFNMLMKDRVYSYRNDLKTETRAHPNKDSISINDGDFQNINSWDSEFNTEIVDKDGKFHAIFENSSDFRKGWLYWRSHRNTGAHGRTYKLNNNDVESLFNWIIQAEDFLHPFVSYKIWIRHLQNILTINNISTIENFNDLASQVNKLTDDKKWTELYDFLYNLLLNVYPEYSTHVIDFIEELYNLQSNKIFQFIDHTIVKNYELDINIKSKFLTEFAIKRPYYSTYIDEKEYSNLVQFITDINVLDSLSSRANNKSIVERLKDISLLNTNYQTLTNTRNLIEKEITNRCTSIRSKSQTREDIIKILSQLPLDQLTESQASILLKSIENNKTIYRQAKNNIPNLLTSYTTWKTNYPNLDYSKTDTTML